MIKKIKTKQLLQQIVPVASAQFRHKLADITNSPQAINTQHQARKPHWLIALIPIEYVAFASLLLCVLTLSMVVFSDQTSLFDESIYAMHELYLDDLYSDHSQLLLAESIITGSPS